MAAPGGPPPGPQPGTNPNLSGKADPTGDPHQDVAKSVAAMYQSVLAANPGLKQHPEVAARTVDQMIQQAKGFDDSERNALKATSDYYMQQVKLQEAQVKADTAVKAIQQRADEAAQKSADRQAKMQEDLDKANARNAELEKVAGIGAGARRYAADQGLAGAGVRGTASVDAARTRAQGGVDAANVRAGGSANDASIRAAAQRDVAETNRKAKENSAAIAKGRPPPYPDAPATAGTQLPAKAAQHLKEGVNTTFANGQTWTMKDGKPVQVK